MRGDHLGARRHAFLLSLLNVLILDEYKLIFFGQESLLAWVLQCNSMARRHWNEIRRISSVKLTNKN